MKSLIKTIVITTTVLSMNVFAASAMESLSIKTIMQTMTPAQVEMTLDNWKSEEMTHIEQRAQLVSDGLSLNHRRELVKQQIEREYSQTAKTFGL
ncbi:MAG: two-component SAPR family response regulator [Psychromonas sp.]|jgi:two-component SAPR family response regulator|uniref:hypothetical protein n=1 Tax=Psychromonas sp. TaxID=1884585 RepID=UPI0039E4B06D